RVISRGIFHNPNVDETVSHETVSSVLRGTSLPAWAKIHSLIVELARESIDDHDAAELLRDFQPLWIAARNASPPRETPAAATAPPTPHPADERELVGATVGGEGSDRSDPADQDIDESRGRAPARSTAPG